MLQQELDRVLLAEVACDVHGRPAVSGVLVFHAGMTANKPSKAGNVAPGGRARQFLYGISCASPHAIRVRITQAGKAQ